MTIQSTISTSLQTGPSGCGYVVCGKKVSRCRDNGHCFLSSGSFRLSLSIVSLTRYLCMKSREAYRRFLYVWVGCSCNNTQCRVSRCAGDTNTISVEAASYFIYGYETSTLVSGTSSGGANGKDDYRHTSRTCG